MVASIRLAPGRRQGPSDRARRCLILANSSEDSQNYRFAADLTGSLYGWDLTLSAGFGKPDLYDRAIALPAAMQAALNNPTAPFRVGSAYGLNSSAAIASVFPTIQGKATDQLAYVTAEASRDIYQLPGGPLSFGVGFDYRHQDLDAEAPLAIAEGLAAGNNAFAVGTPNVGAVYMELAAPIFKWLEVDASVRHDDYAGSFSNTDPKIGFNITPIEQIAFRGTYSEGFRAPNPAENGDAGESFLLGQCADSGAMPQRTDAKRQWQCQLRCTRQLSEGMHQDANPLADFQSESEA